MIDDIIKAIYANKRFLITSHVKLDGDALGSELALYRLLKGLGKEVVIYNQDPTPANYLFLPDADQITHTLNYTDEFDAAFILDCSELERVGTEAPRIGAIRNLINMDHHVSNGGFCDLRLIDTDASSTGELVLRLIEAIGATVTKEMATNLYAAILTDTGGFRYNNTTSEALMAAGRLVNYGADPQYISEHIYENNPMAKVQLLARALTTLSFDNGGTVGSLCIRLRDFAELQASPDLTEGFVDLPRTVEGVMVSLLFTEVSGGVVKVSMRSKDSINVERVARSFGGGGHVNAAACRVEGDMETVKVKVLERIRELLGL
ncbi:MAG: bifunctional oligoribonuclease/PAP phosphatase NrnA [Syntrophales bacterium]|nr:bifunctional oligoribonuclease/PAP phosphatase NrnA [Syntrophales bacterium]